jgi:hypothetical protein
LRGSQNANNERRSFRRRTKSASHDPGQVFRDLKSRTLTDDAQCRMVWEASADPLALCQALTLHGLPRWLVDATLFLLTDPIGCRERLWKTRERHAIDATRALFVSMARSHPEKMYQRGGGPPDYRRSPSRP